MAAGTSPSSPLRERLFARLARRTTSGRFIPEVDGLRFVSIALVVLFHLAGSVAARHGVEMAGKQAEGIFRVIGYGGHGVEAFFVISGFVLGLPFAARHLAGGPPVRLRAYFTRRLTRLEPPYVIAMIALAAALAATSRATAGEVMPHLLASLAYLHNVVFVAPSTINAVAWSLEVEVQFYLLAPLLAAAAFRWRGAVTRRALLLGACVAVILVQRTLMGGVRTVTLAWFIQYFLVGFLLADLYTTAWTRPSRRPWAWDVVWVACWPLLWAAWEVPYGVTAFAFPALLLAFCAASLRGGMSRAVLSNPWVTTIGGMCYTIYLLHPHLIALVSRWTARVTTGSAGWDVVVQAALVVPVVLAACAVFFVLVERPCMDPAWPARLRARLAPRPAPAEAAAQPAVGL